MNRTRLTTINLYAGAIRLAAFASALTAVEPEPPTTIPTTIIAVLSIAKPITARENPASAITTAMPNLSGGTPALAYRILCLCHRGADQLHRTGGLGRLRRRPAALAYGRPILVRHRRQAGERIRPGEALGP